MFLVSGVDPFRGVAYPEVPAALEPAFPLQNGNAHFLRDARIHRALVDHDGPFGEVFAHDPGGALHRGQIGGFVLPDGGGHCHYQEPCLPQRRLVVGEEHGGLLYGPITHLSGGVDPLVVQGDLVTVDIEADHVEAAGKCHSQRHSYVAQPYPGQFLFPLCQAFI